VIGLLLRSAGAVALRDVRSYGSNWARLSTAVVRLAFIILLVYYVSQLVRVPAFATPGSYFAYVVCGLIALQLVSTMLAMPVALREQLTAGVFERVATSPLGPLGTVLAALIFPTLLAVFLGIVVIVLGALAFGLDLNWPTLAWWPLVMVAAGLAFAPLAILLTALTMAFKPVASSSSAIVATLGLVAGIYFPSRLLPDWIAWMSAVQPLTPAAELLRHVIADRALPSPWWELVGRLLLFAVVLGPISVAALRMSIQRARRLGSLTAY
jgi:ABC-2 type transport system permease protein